MPIRRGHVAPRTTVIETIIRKFDTHDRSFLVVNAHQGLCHIIYCSDGFCRLTGFSRAEVMQKSAVCEFLHGPMTSQYVVSALRDALLMGAEKHFEILYYKKDGTKFLCSQVIALIKSDVDNICLLIINFEDLSSQSSPTLTITKSSQVNTKLFTHFDKARASFRARLSRTGIVNSSQQYRNQSRSNINLSNRLSDSIIFNEDISEKCPLTSDNITIMETWNMNQMKNGITPIPLLNSASTAIATNCIATNTYLIQSNIASINVTAPIASPDGISDISHKSGLWNSQSPAISGSVGEYPLRSVSHAASLDAISRKNFNNSSSKRIYRNLTYNVSTKHSKIFPGVASESDLQRWRISKDRNSSSFSYLEQDSVKDKLSFQDNNSAKYFQGVMHTPNMGEKVAQMQLVEVFVDMMLTIAPINLEIEKTIINKTMLWRLIERKLIIKKEGGVIKISSKDAKCTICEIEVELSINNLGKNLTVLTVDDQKKEIILGYDAIDTCKLRLLQGRVGCASLYLPSILPTEKHQRNKRRRQQKKGKKE